MAAYQIFSLAHSSVVQSGSPFDVEIEYEAAAKGDLTASVHVADYEITVSPKSLPKSLVPTKRTVKVTITRQVSTAVVPCIFGLTLKVHHKPSVATVT
jgi:hypothetical protein